MNTSVFFHVDDFLDKMIEEINDVARIAKKHNESEYPLWKVTQCNETVLCLFVTRMIDNVQFRYLNEGLDIAVNNSIEEFYGVNDEKA